MKIAFLSDIHGNALALDEVLKDIRKNSFDKIYVLGDISYRGPEPKRSIEIIRSLETDVIKGNADEWVVRGVRQGEVPDKALEAMNREREWTVSKLDQSDIDYLDKLPFELNAAIEDTVITMFHATPTSLFEIVLPSVDDETMSLKLMSLTKSHIYIYAHIHKPFIRYINGKVIINTGSVGLPFDGVAMASYASLELVDGRVSASIHRVNYDIEKAVNLYNAVNYPNAEMMIRILRSASVELK